jgi:HEAT repeat protein
MTTLSSDDIFSLLRSPDGLAAKVQLRATESIDALIDALVAATDERETCVLVDVLGERHEQRAVSLLVSRLGDPRMRVRFAAADALAKIADPTVGDALLARFLLPEPDPDTRSMLLLGLGAIGYRAAIPVLVRSLQHPDRGQRSAAAWSLAKLGATEALDAVGDAYATERDRGVYGQLKQTLNTLARLRGP